VDINRVRSRLISEWFNGKLNHLLLHWFNLAIIFTCIMKIE
jgi:hypothetical protein